MKSNKAGMVLLVIVGFLSLAAIMVASLHFTSTSQIIRSRHTIGFEKAFYTAEAGIENAKAVLKDSHNGLNDELLGADGLPYTADDGILSFGSPVVFGGGKYQVRIYDNDDSDPSLYVDTDNTVIIRSTGTYQNVSRVLEAAARLDSPIITPETGDAPLGVYGTNAEVVLQGNAFIDGHDYEVPSNFYCHGSGCTGTITTNPVLPGLLSALTTTVISVSESASIVPNTQIGGGDYTEDYWQDLASQLEPLAAIILAGGVLAGNQTLGTRDNPEITKVTGDTKITGTVDGAGILIVSKDVEIDILGNFHYEGIIILLGDGIDDAAIEFNDKGTAAIFGGIVGTGGELDIKPQGSPQICYSSSAIHNITNIDLPPNEMSVVYWREIK